MGKNGEKGEKVAFLGVFSTLKINDTERFFLNFQNQLGMA